MLVTYEDNYKLKLHVLIFRESETTTLNPWSETCKSKTLKVKRT